MRRLLVVAVLVLGGCGSEEAPPLYDFSAERACHGWGEVVRDIDDGVATDAEVRSAIQGVVEPARRSELVGLEDAAVEALAAFTAGDRSRIEVAVEDLSGVCVPVLRWMAQEG